MGACRWPLRFALCYRSGVCGLDRPCCIADFQPANSGTPRRNMPEPAQIVGIGSCTVDYFAIVPRLLGPEEKINATRMEIHAGGVTANNLTQVARLGVTTGWLGLIGDDENGRIIQKAFTADR